MFLRHQLFVDHDIAAGGGPGDHPGPIEFQPFALAFGVEEYELVRCRPGGTHPFDEKLAVADGKLVVRSQDLFPNTLRLVKNAVAASGIAQTEPPVVHHDHRVMTAGDIILWRDYPDALGASADGYGVGGGEIRFLVQNLAFELQTQAQLPVAPPTPRQQSSES